jgi:outer membrane lipoprotein
MLRWLITDVKISCGKNDMKKNAGLSIFFLGLIVGALGCSPPVSSEVRHQAAENLAFTKVLANPSSYRGAVIIWGGVIMKMTRSADHTDLYLWETPEDLGGKPEDTGQAEGAFVARTLEFLDPQTYSEGRKVTVAGEVSGQELGTYNDRPYAYPVVMVKEFHLWPVERPPVKWNWWNIPYYSPYTFSPQPYRQSPPPR